MQWKLGFVGVVLSLVLAACSSEPVQVEGSLTTQVFGTAGDDYVLDVAAPKGGVGAVVVGTTTGALDGVNKGGFDAFIRKYNSSGVVWARQFGTSAFDQATDVAVTPTGISYVVGITNGALGVKVGNLDVFLRKYDANGVGQWTKQFGTTADDYAYDVALDSSGNVYVLMSPPDIDSVFRIHKFNPSGILLQTITQTPYLNYDINAALAVDSTGNIFVLAEIVDDVFFSARLFKYNSAGTLVTSPTVMLGGHIFNSSFSADNLIVDSSNNLYFIVYDTGRNGLGFLRKVDNSGKFLWGTSIAPATTGAVSAPYGLTIGPRGSVFVTGSTNGSYPGFTNAGGGDIFVLQLSGTTGARLWAQQFGGNSGDGGFGIAVSDRVYVAGGSFSNPNLLGNPSHGGRDAFLAQLDRVTGAILSIDQ